MKSSTQSSSTGLIALFTFAFLLFCGCQTAGNKNALAPTDADSTPDPGITMREGDTLRITFPGAKQLDTVQLIRRDGKIVLPTFGEIRAAGLTPSQLEKQILETFGKDLVTKEVTVTMENAQYPVFLNGAVLRPGKIESVRPITVLEAIMEAGGFDATKANLKAVKIIRTEGSEVKTYVVDLRGVTSGVSIKPFYLKPYDIVVVSEKFTLF